MNAKQYLAALDELGLSQIGAGAFFGVSPRTAQRYAADGPPQAVALLLQLLLDLTPPKRAAFIEAAS